MSVTFTSAELRQLVKAFAAQDDYEGHGEVVFARNAMEARRLAAAELNQDEEALTVRRAPEFDTCRDLDELRAAQLDHGWWFTCAYCGDQVSQDGTAFEADDYEYPFEPVTRWGDVYCHGWCAGAEAVAHVERRVQKWTVVEAAMERFPGAVICDVSAITYHMQRRNEIVPTVRFQVPPRYDATFTWQLGDETLLMNEYVLEEWNEYRALRKETE